MAPATSFCIHCGRPTSTTLTATHFKLGSPDPAEVREAALCSECCWKLEPYLRGWRTTVTPPALYGRPVVAARCSNPACKRPATSIVYLGTLSQRIGWGHEVYCCNVCLESLYSQLFGGWG